MYDDKRRILLLMALSRTSPAGTIIAVLIAGAAAASTNYRAVCGANARATKPEVALNDGLSDGPSAEWGSAGSAMQRGPGKIPVLALLPALVYDVLLPLGLAGSQMQGQEPSPRG